MADDDLKVFISWSGDLSREITKVIRLWLPKMFDRIDPWMSDIDIQAGRRGLALIEERLNTSEFGIIVVTVENMEKTWLNFEAGALSKKFGDNVLARVVPIMVDFDDVYQIKGPIHQFQAVRLDRDGMQSLLESITQVVGSGWDAVKARFEWSWEEFEKEIQEARDKAGDQPEAPQVTEKELLERILTAVSATPQRSKSLLPSIFDEVPPHLQMTMGERFAIMEEVLAKYGFGPESVKSDGRVVILRSSGALPPTGMMTQLADELLERTGMALTYRDRSSKSDAG